jgi:hypothetical protein
LSPTDITAADRWVRLPAAALDHRRFWDAMDTVSQAHLAQIEGRIGAVLVERFGLDLAGLVLDMTNFATFIDTGNERAPIAQRGRPKQKRTDLRLVGLALVVTHDGGIPLLSHAYPGDRPDVTQFAAVIDTLVTRYQQIAGGVEALTVTFDAGNDSADNQDRLAETGLHYVGSLVCSQHPDLLAIPARRFTIVDPDRFAGLTAVDTTAEALGGTRRVIVTHSPTFHTRQARGFAQTLAKARRQLAALQTRLARGHTRRSRAQVQADIDAITRPRWLNRVLTVTLTGDTPTELRLTWRTDHAAHRHLEDEYFGKRILFTDRHDWPAAEVIAAYRAQADVEKASGNSKTATWSPSPRCTTGPNRKSGSTSSTACSPSPSPTSCAAKPNGPDYTCPCAHCCTSWPASGNRAPLPLHRRTTQSPPHPHRTQPHRHPTRRHLRHRPPRPTQLGHTPPPTETPTHNPKQRKRSSYPGNSG